MIPNEYTPVFKSTIADKLYGFLLSKRAVGYKYKSEARVLERFDKFLLDEDILEVTDDRISGWLLKREGESDKTHVIRNSVFKQFVIYLNRHGVTVLLPHKTKRSEFSKSFTPYIFTGEQIERILYAADTMPPRRGSSQIRLVMPAILRLLFCCGLRISEATGLRVGNIDLVRGLVTIMNSKNDNCRILPISDSLKKTVSSYLDKVYISPKSDDFVFPTKKLEQYSDRVIYDAFREILWRCGISHGGRGKGPRLHDIRNTHINKIRTFLTKNIVCTYQTKKRFG